MGAYAIAADGTLRNLPGAPVSLPAGASPYAISIAPDGGHLYVPSRDTTPAVYAFAIGADGVPAEIPGSPYPVAADNPFGTAITPDGNYLYTTNYEGESISLFPIDADGSLLPTPPRGVDRIPAAGAVTADGEWLLLSSGSDTMASIVPGGSIGAGPSALFDVGVSGDFQSVALTPAQPPRAKLKAKRKVRKGRKVVLDASRTKDPDSEIASFRWKFGDGRQKTTSRAKVRHRYAKKGRFKVKVTAIDATDCSTRFIGAGQTAYCNGSKRAVATARIRVKRR